MTNPPDPQSTKAPEIAKKKTTQPRIDLFIFKFSSWDESLI